jgi:small-conductance mechanosensitive channel
MRNITIAALLCFSFFFVTLNSYAEPSETEQPVTLMPELVDPLQQTAGMLTSLLELQQSLKEQIQLSRKKYNSSKSEAEKEALLQEISHLDKQLSETSSDFERLATGVEPALFTEKRPEIFSWKEELSSLLEPAIKELKRFTVKARQKTDLKDSIAELSSQVKTASIAVQHLQAIEKETTDAQVRKGVTALQPEWLNVEKRLRNKLELAERELSQLNEQDVSLVESTSSSMRTFFRDRGRYLIVGVFAFFAILLVCRLIYRLIVMLFFKFNGKKEKRSFQLRLLDIIFRVVSVVLAIIGLFFVLYLAEDWFLLSMAIIFFLGLAWTVRQGLPRLWQQVRLMLNIGSVRENERINFHGVAWKVETINVFSKLVNPSLEVELRVPIEDLVGLSSRPYHPEEPWFPCRKGDWVVIGGGSRARVVSLSHEQVEVVERGGKRIVYPTDIFVQSCPVNLSRNFRIRVPFGVSYSLQDQVTSTIPAVLLEYLTRRIEEDGYKKSCLNLQVEFFQANASSLDLLVVADFDGKVADISKRIERAISKWCVECCTHNSWEIPFPQLTVHRPQDVTQPGLIENQEC